MIRAVLADTGPLYAAADLDDQYHRRAQRELGRLGEEKRELVVAYPIFLETYTLVLYRLGRPAAESWLGEVATGATFTNPSAEDYKEALKTVARFRDQKITLFDATLAALARRLGLQVWTYDHHFDVMRVSVWR